MLPEEDLRAAQDALDAAREAVREAARDRDAAIIRASKKLPAGYIADRLHVDRQIVYRVLRRA